MKYYDMTCVECFHGGGAPDDNIDYQDSWGRNTDGAEQDCEDIGFEFVICKLDPNYKLISPQVLEHGMAAPDVIEEPRSHRCGKGLWYCQDRNTYIRLWECEDE